MLERGADVNALVNKDCIALQKASIRGHEKMVNILLYSGADVNAQVGQDNEGSALQAAIRRGHDKLVNILLEKGADVNVRGGLYGDCSALQTAIICGHEKIVNLLLERGADVNTQDGQYGNALQAAIRCGREKVGKILLERGADVNARSGLGTATETVGHKDTRDSDKAFEIRDSIATRDDSPEFGYETTSDGDDVLTVDDLTLPVCDLPLASLRARISDPVEYFSGLQDLAHLTYQQSTLHIYKSHWPRTVAENERNFEPCPGYPHHQYLMLEHFRPLPDSHVIRTCKDVGIFHNGCANDLLEILECRNVSAKTYLNLKRLQRERFCVLKFSMLMIDPCRHDVVRLLPIDIHQILQLLMETDSVLRRAADFARHASPNTPSTEVLLEQIFEEPDNLLLAVPRCTTFLTTLGLALTSPTDTSINLSILACMRLVVHTLDLAVTSYAGAHLGRFDEEYLGEEMDTLDILSPFTSRHSSQVPSIKLSRCHLQCLDSFHNSQPLWVFSSSDWKPRGHLFLSTKIEDFADIWGPLWKVVDPEMNGSCNRYAVGNGSIYKYRSVAATPLLLSNESLCHWISNTNLEADSEYFQNTEKSIFPDILDESFDGNETLLIGAVAAGCERLATKTDCNFDLGNSRSTLDYCGRVQMLGTVREYMYKDSETYQLQAGHSGLNVSASKQYKRRGQSLKQAFVELWTTTPDLRDPRLLEDYYGLQLSLCTQNAQRVQLGRILGLGSMCRYLRSFRWKTGRARQAYFDALEHFRDDSDALQHAWEMHNEYQEDFGRAVLVCLKALEKTGINHKSQLSTFLCSEVTARPELITMEPKEHSWIGLLKDSEISCCMAAVGDECLEFRHKSGSVCGRPGRSCLRTALIINPESRPPGIRLQHLIHEATDGWTSRWSVRAMETSSDVWLGRHGTLRLLHHLPDSTLLMDWRASLITTAVKTFIDKEKPHREYSENIRKDARRTRPIPLFVMSNPKQTG